MNKTILASTVIIGLSVLSTSAYADRCWWNGRAMECVPSAPMPLHPLYPRGAYEYSGDYDRAWREERREHHHEWWCREHPYHYYCK